MAKFRVRLDQRWEVGCPKTHAGFPCRSVNKHYGRCVVLHKGVLYWAPSDAAKSGPARRKT